MLQFIKSWKFWIIIAILLIIGLGPYFFVFNGGLSAESNDWGNFGSYLSGVFGPVLSVVSIFIIIWTVQAQIKSNEKEQDKVVRVNKSEELFSHLTESFILFQKLYLNTDEIMSSPKEATIDEDLYRLIMNEINDAKGHIRASIALSRIYFDGDEELQIRFLIQFVDDFVDEVSNYFHLRGILGGFQPEPFDIHNKYHLEKVAKWYDQIADIVIKKIRDKKNTFEYFQTEDYKASYQDEIEKRIGK